MSDIASSFDFHGLTPPQKLELIGELWDSIPDTAESLEFPQSHRQELERRLADADPDSAIPWEQVRAGLRQQPWPDQSYLGPQGFAHLPTRYDRYNSHGCIAN